MADGDPDGSAYLLLLGLKDGSDPVVSGNSCGLEFQEPPLSIELDIDGRKPETPFFIFFYHGLRLDPVIMVVKLISAGPKFEKS